MEISCYVVILAPIFLNIKILLIVAFHDTKFQDMVWFLDTKMICFLHGAIINAGDSSPSHICQPLNGIRRHNAVRGGDETGAFTAKLMAVYWWGDKCYCLPHIIN